MMRRMRRRVRIRRVMRMMRRRMRRMMKRRTRRMRRMRIRRMRVNMKSASVVWDCCEHLRSHPFFFTSQVKKNICFF